MARHSWALVAGLLLLAPAAAPAAEPDLAGTWKVTMLDSGEQPTLWLIRLGQKDGKWQGEVLSAGTIRQGRQLAKLPASTLSDLSVSGDLVRLTITMEGHTFGFEGKLPPDKAGNVRGSMSWLNGQLFPAELEPTKLTSLDDAFEVNKETVARGEGNLKFFNATMDLLGEAGEKKAKPEEVRGWADRAFKAADAYGPRWQRDIATQIARALLGGDGFADVAVTYARRAERLLELDTRAQPIEKLRVLGTLAAALKKADKPDELKEVEARLDKIDLSVKPEKDPGRKGNSDRVVLVELFTGAECPPCVGADLAFDALTRTYKPTEVAFLEYHEHIPGPDPLTSPGSEARLEYYQQEVEGTPTFLFNGRPLQESGGTAEDAPELYQDCMKLLGPILEKPAGARLTATAVRKGNKVEITVEAADVERPDAQLRLRVALVEEEVRYAGGNQVRRHHDVVRAFAGGPQGVAVRDKTAKETSTIDLDALRKSLTESLNDYAKNSDRPFSSKDRPMELKNLKVVAFLQNDRTKEVVQAVQVDVRPAE